MQLTPAARTFNVRLEVMKSLEKKIDGLIDKYLIPVESIWQPSDFLPDARDESFIEEIKTIQGEAKELDHDFWAILVGDMITEEALPTYESWLMDVEGVDQREGEDGNGWARWIRMWSGEENRHGDLLNKYLYLSGRVDMKAVEHSVHHLINDGFDPGTDRDPYKNFVYTSFQELATFISHKRVGQIAAQKSNFLLSRICKTIAGDEMRHHLAYSDFVKSILEVDASELILAFADMMKKKIVMPANLVKESGRTSDTFVEFSNCAQRLGVYTAMDYVDILSKLNKMWKIDQLPTLTDEAERARDYLMKLPARLTRIAERMTVPETATYKFSWVATNGMV